MDLVLGSLALLWTSGTALTAACLGMNPLTTTTKSLTIFSQHSLSVHSSKHAGITSRPPRKCTILGKILRIFASNGRHRVSRLKYWTPSCLKGLSRCSEECSSQQLTTPFSRWCKASSEQKIGLLGVCLDCTKSGLGANGIRYEAYFPVVLFPVRSTPRILTRFCFLVLSMSLRFKQKAYVCGTLTIMLELSVSFVHLQ